MRNGLLVCNGAPKERVRDKPLFVSSAVGFLKLLIRESFTVFEYGSGGSTQWLSKHARSVVTVDHDESWWKAVSELGLSNVDCRLRSLDGGYVEAIAEDHAGYDLVVVDGRLRNECLEIAERFVAPGGIIVLDNSLRPRYQAGVTRLREHGFVEVGFTGDEPDGDCDGDGRLTLKWKTSFFRKRWDDLVSRPTTIDAS